MTMLPKDLLHLVFSFVEGMGINEVINACFVHYIGLKNHTQGEHPDVEYAIKLTGPLGEELAKKQHEDENMKKQVELDALGHLEPPAKVGFL